MACRRPRFTTSWLMAAVALVAVALMLGKAYWHATAPERARRRMLETFGRLGAHYMGEHRFDPVPPVVQLSLGDVTDADLAKVPLPDLPDLYSFGVRSSGVTDTGLASLHLEGMPRLKRLNLDHTSVSGPGLRKLRELHHLETLNLDGSQVADAGLAHLAGLANLEDLEVRGTAVTDAGLVRLAGRIGLKFVTTSSGDPIHVDYLRERVARRGKSRVDSRAAGGIRSPKHSPDDRSESP